jgi:hypothetical protein
LNDGQAGGGEGEDSLAGFVDGEKAAVQGVDVGGKCGERLREENTETETAAVSVDKVDAALNADGGRSRGSGTSEEGLIEDRAGGMQSHAGDREASGNLLQLRRGGRGGRRKIGGANFGGDAGARGEDGGVGGAGDVERGLFSERGGELIGRGGGPGCDGTAGGRVVSEKDVVTGGV